MSDHTQKEEWRDIPGWEGSYQASSHGRIRSLDRKIVYPNGKEFSRRGRVLSPAKINSGYLHICLHRNQKQFHYLVHVLVLEAFVGPRPDGFQACHNDGNRLNNHAYNLRWDTIEANHADKIRHGTNRKKLATHCKNGHEFTAENTRIVNSKSGYPIRRCAKCMSDKRKVEYWENPDKFRKVARDRYRDNYAIPLEEHKPNISEINSAKTHCKRGHLLQDPNLTPLSKKKGHRVCRTCANGLAYMNRHPDSGLDEKVVLDYYFNKIMLH